MRPVSAAPSGASPSKATDPRTEGLRPGEWCRGRESNPHGHGGPLDPESSMTTNSITPA